MTSLAKSGMTQTYKILIIDDHQETLDIISRVLRQQGYLVVSTASALKGLEMAESERPDLILLDGMMPEMDGWDVCRRIRANEPIATTPIIMFSAVNKAEQKLAGFDAGADDYLTKPTEPIELGERVKALLDGVKPRHEITSEALTPAFTSDLEEKADTAADEKTHLTAVLGVRGGVGTTLFTLNLAASLAHQKLNTVLVDLDVCQGHIGLYLNQKVTNGLNKLARLPEGMLAQEVGSHLQFFNDYLDLLLTDSNLWGKEPTPSPEQVLELTRALTVPERHVIVDCTFGITPLTQPVIEQANDIIVCLQPERVALASAKNLFPQLQEMLIPPARLSTILLDFSGGMNVPQKAIESFLGHKITAVIPIKPGDLRRSVNKSTPLVQTHPEAEATVKINHFTQDLIKA